MLVLRERRSMRAEAEWCWLCGKEVLAHSRRADYTLTLLLDAQNSMAVTLTVRGSKVELSPETLWYTL